MRKPGYTLIELLLSAAIFAGVLMLAFALVATINRLSRRSEDSRQIIFNTSALMDTLVQYSRSASPVRGEHDALCSISSPDNVQQATLKGIYQSDSTNIYVNLRQTTTSGTVSYKTYRFYLEQADPPTINISGTLYGLYRPKLQVYNVDGNCNYNADSQGALSLLPDDELILVAPGQTVFDVQKGALNNNDPNSKVGDLWLSPTAIDEISSQLVTFNLTFVKQSELSNPESVNKYSYLTTVTPRPYQVTFVTQ